MRGLIGVLQMHCYALFFVLGMVASLFLSKQACAADLPPKGPDYLIEVYASICGSVPLFAEVHPNLNARNVGPSIARWYIHNHHPRTAVGVGSYTADVLPTDGTCVTATATTNLSETITVRIRPVAVISTSGDLSVEDSQLIILSALLLWGLAWGFRQFQRVGTQHHD